MGELAIDPEVEATLDMDEDAAAFLQEAAEAAAAEELARQGGDDLDEALSDAEALVAEMEADAALASDTGDVDEDLADSDAALLEAEVLDSKLGANAALASDAGDVDRDPADPDAALLEAEALISEMEADAALASDTGDVGQDPADPEAALLEAEALIGELEIEAAAAADEDPEAALLEAESLVAGLDAELPASAGGDGEETLRAQLELSEESQTAEEQALAQAEDEKDPEADVVPADIAEIDEELHGSLEKIAAKARRLNEDQVRHVIHSLLFVTDRPLTLEQLRNATGLENSRIRPALERLAGDLREGISGVILSEVAGGWQLRTAPESSDFVRRFLQVKPRRLTRAALETLAIIAYRQPVTRPEIEDIRGVDCGAVVKALLDWKLIKILGKKDEVGRPLIYGTSREFLEFFQLKDLASLPTLREFHELTEESRQIVEEELGPDAALEISGTVAELSDPAYLEEERLRIAQSEAALADLEQALADAEEKATAVAHTINPPKDPETASPDPVAEES